MCVLYARSNNGVLCLLETPVHRSFGTVHVSVDSGFFFFFQMVFIVICSNVCLISDILPYVQQSARDMQLLRTNFGRVCVFFFCCAFSISVQHINVLLLFVLLFYVPRRANGCKRERACSEWESEREKQLTLSSVGLFFLFMQFDFVCFWPRTFFPDCVPNNKTRGLWFDAKIGGCVWLLRSHCAIVCLVWLFSPSLTRSLSHPLFIGHTHTHTHSSQKIIRFESIYGECSDPHISPSKTVFEVNFYLGIHFECHIYTKSKNKGSTTHSLTHIVWFHAK